jgi:hypothetical protein
MSSVTESETESETASPQKKPTQAPSSDPSSPEPEPDDRDQDLEMLYVSESDEDMRFFRVSSSLSQYPDWHDMYNYVRVFWPLSKAQQVLPS